MTRPTNTRPTNTRSTKTRPTKPRTQRPPARRRQTVKNALLASVNYVAPAPGGDDPVPDDIDVFRLALSRRIAGVLGMPRRCREPVCRRSKLCKGPDMRCARDFPARKLSPEEDARLQAKVYRLVKQRIAELEAGGA
jgi:hypothetical protein